jgi:hypothetical protein
MPIPSVIGDLSTTASSNGPAGSETPTDGDGYLRAHAGFIAELRDKLNGTGDTGTIKNATFSGTMAGAASWSGLQTFAGGIANINSSTYTPTLTAVSNVSSIGAANTYIYVRVESVVIVFGNASITATGAGTCSFGISLPVASDFTTGIDAHGLCNSGVSGDAGFGISSDSTNNRVTANVYATGAGARAVWVLFGYRVL